jgi:hypothetical protein
MSAMADLARQNMELWSRMQESMLGAFVGRRPAGPGADEQPDEQPGEQADDTGPSGTKPQPPQEDA